MKWRKLAKLQAVEIQGKTPLLLNYCLDADRNDQLSVALFQCSCCGHWMNKVVNRANQ